MSAAPIERLNGLLDNLRGHGSGYRAAVLAYFGKRKQ